jgi:RHS repeat-associated protein
MDNEGGEPYGYTGEWWEDEVGLLHLRARWYLPGEGVFMSRDPVESEPPYLYVHCNPVNLADPSGMVPWEKQVAHGEASYSCNCGWIDWSHLMGGRMLANGIFNELDQPISLVNIFWNAAPPQFDSAPTVRLSFYKDPNLTNETEKARIALGIYKEIQWQIEEFQGVMSFSLGMNTHFSEEDLPSDLIGFYIAYWERYNNKILSTETIKHLIKTMCGVLNIQDSLEIREAYMTELPPGDIGEGGFVRWRKWEGRLVGHLPCSWTFLQVCSILRHRLT